MLKVQPVILAAGKGSRMQNNTSKALCKIAEKPMLQHILDAICNLSNMDEIDLTEAVIVVGHKSEEVIKSTPLHHSIQHKYIEQKKQLGTGHAIKIASTQLDPEAIVIVLYADVPLIEPKTLLSTIQKAHQNGFSLITVHLEEASGYGRIIRDNQLITSIVEHKDANIEQLKIQEVNTGILAAKGKDLARWSNSLKNENNQGEYYLTDVIAMAVNEGYRIADTQPSHEEEVMGVNTLVQLAQAERSYQLNQANKLMNKGVQLADPNRIDIRGKLDFGSNCYIDVNTVFEGQIQIGDNVVIEANCVIRNSTIGNNCIIKANSYIEKATLADKVVVGPFARLREGTNCSEGSKIGNFVETKKVNIGANTKVNHLSYIGDAELGEQVNLSLIHI